MKIIMKKTVVGFLACVLFNLACLGTHSAHAAGFKVGGFADAQFQWQSTTATQGFLINDAAIRAEHSMDQTRVYTDLPFTFTATNFAILGNKAQLFLEHKFSSTVDVTLGKFDTMFSQENNDFDRNWAMFASAVDSNLNPTSFMGVLTGLHFGDIGVAALLADTRNNNTLNGGGQLDIGVQLSYFPGKSGGHLGFLVNPANTIGWIMDIGMSLSLQKLTLDLGFDLRNVSNVSGYGIYGRPLLSLNDKWDVGTRIEYVKPNNTQSVFQLELGPNYRANKELTLKLHYQLNSTDAGLGAVTSHAAGISGVYSI
jgi:hypothetical protein